MVSSEQKRWLLYTYLPSDINRLYIYLPTATCSECEKYLNDLSEYLYPRLDTIGKVTRFDETEIEMFEPLKGLDGKQWTFPIVVFKGQRIEHRGFDFVKSVANTLPDVEVSEIDQNNIKILKDGKNIL